MTGVGISRDGSHWVHCRRARGNGKHFFIPQGLLKRVFRGKLIDFLKRAYQRGNLQLHGQIAFLAWRWAFEQRLNESVKRDWVVDIRCPFHVPEIVLKYPACYTHRVAIYNNRPLKLDGTDVLLRYKDYSDAGEQKTLRLEATEFICRFLLHVLPKGFMKIRHYGFLANRFRRKKLATRRHRKIGPLLPLGHSQNAVTGRNNPSTESVGMSFTAPAPRFNPHRLCGCGFVQELLSQVPSTSTGTPTSATAQTHPNHHLLHGTLG